MSLYFGAKRIPEPFCLVDMGVTNGQKLHVKLADGALTGEALRQQTLKEIEEDERLQEEEDR